MEKTFCFPHLRPSQTLLLTTPPTFEVEVFSQNFAWYANWHIVTAFMPFMKELLPSKFVLSAQRPHRFKWECINTLPCLFWTLWRLPYWYPIFIAPILKEIFLFLCMQLVLQLNEIYSKLCMHAYYHMKITISLSTFIALVFPLWFW